MRLTSVRNVLLIGVGTVLLAIGLRVADPSPVVALRNFTFDTFQRLAQRPYADVPVRVVDIDDRSLAEIGQWPWPRTRVAALVERLADLGAATIALDVIFAEPDRMSPSHYVGQLGLAQPELERQARQLLLQLPDTDQVLAQAMQKAPVVVGYATTDEPNPSRPADKSGYAFAGTSPTEILRPFRGSITSLAPLQEAASGVGSLSLGQDSSSAIVRQVPLLFSDGQRIYSSLTLEALRVAQGAASVTVRSTGASRERDTGKPALVDLRVGQFPVPLTPDGELLLRFDRDRPDRSISARDILDPRRDAENRPRIEGHIVFVGTSAAGLFDRRITPVGTVPGVAIHAQAAEQIIAQDFLRRPDWANGLETVITAAVGILVALLLLKLNASFAALVISGAVALLVGGAWFAFSELNLLVDPAYPAISSVVVYFAVTALLYLTSDRDKRFVRRAFGQYLAPELLAKLEAAPERLRLGGEVRPMTIMFMDIRDFTPISERLSPEALVHFLNVFFSPLTEAIQDEKGIVDKYIGDSIMAFWNAPVDVSDHAARACSAALKMRALVDHLNETNAFGFRTSGQTDIRVQIGIGLNTGEACVGNMGSQQRFNYTVVGDAVNVAARIESRCKEAGVPILISENTAKAVPEFALLEAGAILLKGKSQPVRLFALLGDATEAQSASFQNLAREHRRMLNAIANRQDREALDALLSCRLMGGKALASFYDGFYEMIRNLRPIVLVDRDEPTEGRTSSLQRSP